MFFSLLPGEKNFRVYQGNVLSFNQETGEHTSHYDHRVDDIAGRPRGSGRDDPARVAQMLGMLNAAIANRDRSSPDNLEDSDDSDYFMSDSDGDDDGYDSCASEIECNDKDKIIVRKGEKINTFKKLKESAPRRHPLFKDVNSEPEDKDALSLLSLDDRCLKLILSYVRTIELFKLSTVCKKLYNLCSEALSSKEKLVSRDFYSESLEGFLVGQTNFVTVLSATGGNLKSLQLDTGMSFDIVYCGIYFTKEISTAVSRYCCNLEELIVEFSKLGGLVGLLSFAKHLPAKNKLKSLALKGINRKDGTVLTEAILGDLLKKMKNLERLHIESCDLIDGSSIIKFLKNHKMTSITFCNCKNLKVSFLDFILKTYHSTIENLGVYESSADNPNDWDYDLITNSSLLNVGLNKSPMLKKVHTFYAMKYDDCIIPMWYEGNVNLSLLQLMPNLKVLDLSTNCDLDKNPYLFRSIAAMCPLIEVLKLAAAKARNVRALKHLENLFFLKDLSLENACSNYQTPKWSIFDHTTFAREVLPLLTALTHLNLEQTDIRDKHILSLIQNSKTLTFLEADIEECTGSFIDKCRNLARSTPMTISTWISNDEMKSSKFAKLRSAIERCPEFLKVDTQSKAMPGVKGWYNDW